VAGATPCVSFLITGMPPAPVLAFMVPQAMALCGVAALVFQRLGLGRWYALAAGILAERVVLVIAVAGLVPLLGLPRELLQWGALIVTLPGIALQVLLVPLLVRRLQRSVPGGVAHE